MKVVGSPVASDLGFTKLTSFEAPGLLTTSNEPLHVVGGVVNVVSVGYPYLAGVISVVETNHVFVKFPGSRRSNFIFS